MGLIREALTSACSQIGQDISAVSMLASSIVKQNEAGLLQLGETLGIDVRFFDNAALQEKIFPAELISWKCCDEEEVFFFCCFYADLQYSECL